MKENDQANSETLTIRARLGDDPERLEEMLPYLLVFEEDSSFVFKLPREGEIVIGRSSQVDLRLRDNSASRSHAGLKVRSGVVTIADLSSHNGTQVNGEIITAPRQLQSGDAITICSATLVLKRGVPGTSKRPVLDEKGFLQRLEEELERALRYSPELQLLCVDLGEGGATAVADVSAALAGKLRLMDVAGSTARQEILVLLPELDSEEALHTGKALLSAVHSIAPAARAGHAACPVDGCDMETLLAGARAAARAAPPGGFLTSSEVLTTRELGGRHIVVADPAMVRCYALVERLAESDLPVLIYGETGVGKEIIAEALHALSPRRAARMVTLNCAAIQDTLVESELFGYERGAFSGATSAKAGLLESADGGTMFLDEVAELSPAAQAKLLRVLETRKLTRLGDVRERSVNIRLVAATHRDLSLAIGEKRFREDLYFRLSAARIMVPPLRDRRREIRLLAHRFLAESSARLGRPPSEISAAAMQVIHLYRWPGNLREFRNTMEFIAATVREAVVHVAHLPDSILAATAQKVAEEGLALEEATGSHAPSVPASPGASPVVARRTFRPIEEELCELERTRMAEALEEACGVRVKAAQLLSMPLRTFATKLKLYGLGAPERSSFSGASGPGASGGAEDLMRPASASVAKKTGKPSDTTPRG